MDGLLARVPRTAVNRWMAQTLFTGREIMESFFAPFQSALAEMMLAGTNAGRGSTSVVRRLEDFARRQPPCMHAAVKALVLDRMRILNLHDIHRALDSAARTMLFRAIRKGATFYLSDHASSSTLALLLLLHALAARARTSVRAQRSLDALASDDVRVVVLSAPPLGLMIDPPTTNPGTAVLVEDALYSGGAAVRALRQAEAAFGPAREVCVLAGYAHPDAMASLARTLGPERTLVCCGASLRPIFHGPAHSRALEHDLFLEPTDTLNPDAPATSYLFDVLKLDDRNCLDLLPHKFSDVAAAPHLLLNAPPMNLPPFRRAFRIASRQAADRVEADRGVCGPKARAKRVARNAYIASCVKTNWRALAARGDLVEVPCSQALPSSAADPPKTTATNYEALLARFV